MFLHGKIEETTANGPGKRAALWFQGCKLNCPGCHNPGTHPFDAARWVDLESVQTWIANLPEDLDGITFSGGEPVQHFPDLYILCRYIRETRPGWSIGMFTGYTVRELETGNFVWTDGRGFHNGDGAIWAELLPFIDWAVMGRFNPSKMTTAKPLCGSSNQNVVLFSDRHNPEDFRPVETNVTIDENGLVQITGFPGLEFIRGMQSK